MSKCWFHLKPETQQELAKFYRELAGKDFRLPKDEEPNLSFNFKLENLEEIDRLMRQRPNPKRIVQ